MKVHFNELILEVTRRCNMTCEHCLRGAAQRLDMDRKVVDAVLDATSSISQVVFTGGEPSLNVPLIQYTATQIRERNIPLEGFFLVTNGKKESLPLVMALIDLYDICDSHEEDFMCGFEMSQDQYHFNEAILEVPKLYKALKFFNPSARKEKYKQLINEGRAKANGLGSREVSQDEWYISEYNDTLSVSNQVYIAANGNVVTGCDMSFRRIDRESQGNVLKESLVDIVAQHEKEEAQAA